MRVVIHQKRFIVLLLCCSTYVFFHMVLYNMNLTTGVYELDAKRQDVCQSQLVETVELERNFALGVHDFFDSLPRDSVSEKHISGGQKWSQATSDIYLYSAYIELCPEDLFLSSKFCVKFIALVRSSLTARTPLSAVMCTGRNQFATSTPESAVLEILPEGHNKLFTAAFLFCVVKNELPTHASVFERDSPNPVWLNIDNHKLWTRSSPNKLSKRNKVCIKDKPEGIHLCLRPLFGNFDVERFMEFLAYYSEMGVSHFTFYYLKAFASREIFLKALQFCNVSSESSLWDIPFNNDLVHEYGQLAFTHDCLARGKNRFTHTIIVDIDEFVFPRVHGDLKSLMVHLDETYIYAGSYVISMVLFCKEYPIQISYMPPLQILNHNVRQKTPWVHGCRSKFIAKPDRLRLTGVHFAHKFEKNFKEVRVPHDIALVYHYRYCCGMIQPMLWYLLHFRVSTDDTVADNSLIERKEKLLNNELLKFMTDISTF